MIFFALDQNFKLAKNIAKKFGKELIVPNIVNFADGEMRIDLPKGISVKEETVYIIHSAVDPVNKNYMKLFFLSDLLKLAGAKRVVAVIPYFGYSRQCNHDKTEKIGHAKTIAKLIEACGVDEVVSLEIHDDKLESFFNIPFKNILLRNFIAENIKSILPETENWCLVAPDAGAKERVQELVEMIGIDAFFFCKERSGIDVVSSIVGKCEGSCKGKNAIIIDDIINTGNTALKVVDKLVEQGVSKIYAYFIHPILSDDAAQKLQNSSIDKIFVTNSVELTTGEKISKIEILDVSQVIFDAIHKI